MNTGQQQQQHSNLIATDYFKNATIHHIKRKKDQYLSKWKVYPSKDIKETMIDYVYCFLTTAEGNHCFIVKQKCTGNDLFLINATKFRETCPNKYETFYDNIDSYNSMLADLEETIEEQKKTIERCFNFDILKPYKTNSYLDISKLPASEDVKKAITEIRCLFFLELEIEMAKYMRININAENGLPKFILDFYENRDSAYSFITKEDVCKTAEALYDDIIDQS